jgi:hypothetical protein
MNPGQGGVFHPLSGDYKMMAAVGLGCSILPPNIMDIEEIEYPTP